MKLEFIALDKLSIARTNMRYGRKAPDVSDILPTVRRRGVLQSLLVRPGTEPGTFAIVAGRRRYHAARIVAEERRAAAPGAATDAGDADPPDAMLPCAILDDGDDADAVEASLIENIARLDADEVTRWQTFTRLVREGRSVEDIGLTFGLPDLTVRRVLALGNLLPRIRALYAADRIDCVTVRHLTLASKRQQQDWLALGDDPERRAPTGHQLKAWLFGGQSIAVRHALFDVEASGLAVVADLFGEDTAIDPAERITCRGPADVSQSSGPADDHHPPGRPGPAARASGSGVAALAGGFLMADLKLARLPDRTPVKLTIAVLPELHQALEAYAALYATTYGREEPIAELVPAMLAAFLEGDREFAKVRRNGASAPR